MRNYKIGSLTIEQSDDGLIIFSASGMEYSCRFSKLRLSGRYIIGPNLTAKMPVPAEIFEDVPNHAIASVEKLAQYLDRVLSAMEGAKT